jgi:hypothetical protein
MKLFGGILVLIMGIIISLVAAWFSVTGMMALFAANALGVMAMMMSLEAGKLVGAGWLKLNWKNPNVSFVHRYYLLSAVCVLSAITSLGIYGYLAAGHLEQAAPQAQLQIQAQPLQQQLDQKNLSNQQLTQRLNQIDQNIGVFLKNDQASKGLRASNSLKRERDQIQKQIDANNTDINDLNTKLAPLKMQNSEVEAKLGPVKYFAALIGWDADSAVRLVICMIVSVFDVFAVVLLLSALTSFREWLEDRKKAPKKVYLSDGIVPSRLVEDMIMAPVTDEDVGDDEIGIDLSPNDWTQFGLTVTDDEAPGYDVGGFDADPLDLRVGKKDDDLLKPLDTKPPAQPEGSKFSPNSFSFSLGPTGSLGDSSNSFRAYDGFWSGEGFYRPKGSEPKKEEPTFKVLELPEDAIQPTGQLEPEERTDYSLEDADEHTHSDDEYTHEIIELEDKIVAQKADIAALIEALKEAESEKEALNNELSLERNLNETQRLSYTAVTETLSKLAEDHRNLKAEKDAEQAQLTEELRKWAEQSNQPTTKEMDRDTLIAILERHPGIINEIEHIVESDVVHEMSDREKLLDLLEKNPSVINDMAEIIAAQITKGPSGPGWLDR